MVNGFAGIDEIGNSIGINVYPNPATDKINVSFNAENTDYTINVSDVIGRVVSTSTYFNFQINNSDAI